MRTSNMNGYQHASYADDLLKASPPIAYTQQSQLQQQTPNMLTNGTNGQFDEIAFTNSYQNMTLNPNTQSQVYLSSLNAPVYCLNKSTWPSQELGFPNYAQN